MIDETFIINDVKEKYCYTSLNFHSEMEKYSQGLRPDRYYVLPDFRNRFSGTLYAEGMNVSTDYLLNIQNLRIMVPELLFHPSDIGLHEGGL
mmetsp:Transcript_24563/g.11756  ORF Transcript_24563/g.11756 Transcript_24563/m.11756 type:complete len:92 (-) Transcript_24563:114-389(-)